MVARNAFHALAALTFHALAGVGLLTFAGGCGLSWQPLFDGRTLQGWRAVGNAVWKVEDGAIVGQPDAQNRPGDLVTEKDYGDFELDVTFKVVWPANSGIWFRWADHKGYQLDILDYPNPKAYTGTLYCDGKMFLAINDDPSLVNRAGWNRGTISAIGDHIVVTLNGRKVADVRDTSYQRGAIGFQVHPGEEFKNMKIIVRDVRIRVLDSPGPRGHG